MYLIIKRFFDILFSFIAIVILLPFMLPVSIILLMTGEHYIFYKQERVGFKNSYFKINKFATMLLNSPNMDGGLLTLKKDPRLLPIGGFLRTTKINELPQLINILSGEMSFVGPRPLMQKSFDSYPDDVKKVIYNVKPGLTGIGSIVFRDEEKLITKVKNEGGDTWHYYRFVIYPYKGELEKWYQENQSFWVDFSVLFLTAWTIVFPENQLVFKMFKSLPKRKAETNAGS